MSVILSEAKDPGLVASIKTRRVYHKFFPAKPAITPRSFAPLRMTENSLSRSYVAPAHASLYHIRLIQSTPNHSDPKRYAPP